ASGRPRNSLSTAAGVAFSDCTASSKRNSILIRSSKPLPDRSGRPVAPAPSLPPPPAPSSGFQTPTPSAHRAGSPRTAPLPYTAPAPMPPPSPAPPRPPPTGQPAALPAPTRSQGALRAPAG